MPRPMHGCVFMLSQLILPFVGGKKAPFHSREETEGIKLATLDIKQTLNGRDTDVLRFSAWVPSKAMKMDPHKKEMIDIVMSDQSEDCIQNDTKHNDVLELNVTISFS
jgi:hypothetical protein